VYNGDLLSNGGVIDILITQTLLNFHGDFQSRRIDSHAGDACS
jgi:hypothetical protein